MRPSSILLICVLSTLFLVSGRTDSSEENINTNDETNSSQIANPASVYCEEQGHTVEIRNSERGQVGICINSVGKECEEWEFYNGECEL